MLEQSNEARSFSASLRRVKSWLARLKSNKPKNATPAPARWLNPEQSVGTYCCTVGQQTFWEVKDPGRKELAPLEAKVQELLNTQHEDFKEREASNLSFSVFMVGRNEATSCPTVVIISANKRSGPSRTPIRAIH
jgi:hypothetical protein